MNISLEDKCKNLSSCKINAQEWARLLCNSSAWPGRFVWELGI